MSVINYREQKRINRIFSKLACPEAKDLYLAIALAGGTVEFCEFDCPIIALANLINIKCDVANNQEANEKISFGLQMLQERGLIKIKDRKYSIVPKLRQGQTWPYKKGE